MGQVVFAEHCGCCCHCCCCDTVDTEIKNEIKSKPIKKKRKTKPKAKSNKAPILKQSLSDSTNIAFARLEDAQPSGPDHDYTENKSKQTIHNEYNHNDKLNKIYITNTVINAPHNTQETTDPVEETHNIFIQMDNAIGDYYQMNGITDYYTDTNYNKQGKFLKYVIANQSNPNDIQSQFTENIHPNNCMYLQFDYDNFPINKDNSISKDEQIFNVLKHCYAHGRAPINTQTTSTEIQTDVHTPIDDLNMVQYDNDTEESASLSNSGSNTILIQSDQYESDQENNLIPKADDAGLYNDYDKNEPVTRAHSGQQYEYDENVSETSSINMNEIPKNQDNKIIEQMNPLSTQIAQSVDTFIQNQPEIQDRVSTHKIVIEQVDLISTTATTQSVDSYIKSKQSDVAISIQDSNKTSVTRDRAHTHKILIQPPVATHLAHSVDSYMDDGKKGKNVHAKYDRDLYLEREIGRLDTGKWEHHMDNNGKNVEHGPDKVLKEDTSWVKTTRRASYHAPHESLVELKLKKVASKGKLFEALLTPIESPIDDEFHDKMNLNLLNRTNRAHSMPPVKQ